MSSGIKTGRFKVDEQVEKTQDFLRKNWVRFLEDTIDATKLGGKSNKVCKTTNPYASASKHGGDFA